MKYRVRVLFSRWGAASRSQVQTKFQDFDGIESVIDEIILDFINNEDVFISGSRVESGNIKNITVLEIPEEEKDENNFVNITADVISRARKNKKSALVSDEVSPVLDDPSRVFVVHGRNGKIRDSVFNFLRSIGLSPIEWSEARRMTGRSSPYIGDILDAAFNNAQAVVVLMTPDDEAYLKTQFQSAHDPSYEKEPTGQARPNVLFEAGMAMGKNPDRTVIVEVGSLRPFSDIGGRHTVRMDGSVRQRQELAMRLEDAGCPVNRDGTDWHTVGDFSL